jgi:hypothetical protein
MKLNSFKPRADVVHGRGKINMNRLVAKKGVLALVIASGLVVAGSTLASSTAEPVWGNGTLAGFDPADLNIIGGVELLSVSCTSPGNCTAVGKFMRPSNSEEPFTISSTNGVWGDPHVVAFADGVQASYSESALRNVSCTSPGNCTAVGHFTNSQGRPEAFTVTSTNGTWSLARPVVFNNGVQSSPPDATLFRVSCSSPGNCTTVGSARTASGYEAFTVTSTDGSWANALPVSFPAGLRSSSISDALNGVSCTSAGNCTAVGSFTNTNGDYETFTVTSTNGTWAQAQPVVFPVGTQNTAPYAEFRNLSCTSPGNCTAIGYFFTAAATTAAFTVTSTNGNWSFAARVTFPAGTQNTAEYSEGGDVSCTSAGNCTAVGRFRSSAGGTETFTTTATGGIWAPAQPVIFPAGVQSTGPDDNFYGVSCTSAGNCTAVGTFKNHANLEEGFSITSVAGTWGTARPATVSAGGVSIRRPGRLRSVSCTSTGLCTAVGAMQDENNKSQGYMMSSNEAPQPATTVDTTTPTATPTTTATTIDATTPTASSPTATTTTTTSTTTTSVSVLPAPSLTTIRNLPDAKTPISSDESLTPGKTISVTYRGFTPFEYVQLVVASTPRVIGSGFADAAGVVTITGKLPATLPAGSHTLAVYAPTSGIGFSQAISVASSDLPLTGSRASGTVASGLWFLAIGCAVQVFWRRRRPATK